MEDRVSNADVLAQEIFRLARPQPVYVAPTATADELVAFGREKGWIFRKLDYTGLPQDTARHGDMEYRILTSDDTTPEWVRQRIEAVRAHFPDVKAFVIGEEVGLNQLEVVEEKLRQASEAALRALKLAAMAAAVIIAAIAVVSLLAAVAVLAAGALTVGAAAGAVSLDPQVIAIIGEEEQWVSLTVWYD